MKAIHFLNNLEFNDDKPAALPLHADKQGRILRFTLRPGQSLKEHHVPQSPVYIVVLKGQGIFIGNNAEEHELGPQSGVVFEPGENHSVRALDQDLVFVAFLHGASHWH